MLENNYIFDVRLTSIRLSFIPQPEADWEGSKERSQEIRSPQALREFSRLCIRKILFSKNGKSAPAATESIKGPDKMRPNPTNVLPLLKLAHEYGIPFLMRNCEKCLKQCSEIPAIDRFLLAMKYDLSSLKLDMKKYFCPDDFVKILGELTILEHKQEVFSMMSNYYLGKVLEKGTEILSEVGPEFLHKNIAERMGNCNCA